MIRVFLDSSVLLAAVASLRGGSAFLLDGAQQGRFEVCVSHLVLLEVERNVRKKLPTAALKRFHHLLETTPIQIVPSPTSEELHLYQALIHEKDVPILAAAMRSGSAYLVTLDRRDFLTEKIRTARLSMRVVTPKQFFEEISSDRPEEEM